MNVSEDMSQYSYGTGSASVTMDSDQNFISASWVNLSVMNDLYVKNDGKSVATAFLNTDISAFTANLNGTTFTNGTIKVYGTAKGEFLAEMPFSIYFPDKNATAYGEIIHIYDKTSATSFPMYLLSKDSTSLSDMRVQFFRSFTLLNGTKDLSSFVNPQ